MNLSRRIITEAISFYGRSTQCIVCMEEMAELIQAISKELRGMSDREHLIEETADAAICIAMLREIFDIGEDEFDAMIERKQKRIEERMMKNAEL